MSDDGHWSDEKQRPGGEHRISRRQFLRGSVTLAALAAGAPVLSACSSDEETQEATLEPTELSVAEDSVLLSSDFEELDYSECVTEAASFDLPMGSIANMDDDSIAVVLSPGSTNDVLVSLGLLSISSQTLSTVLERAVSDSEGYQIYDARGNGQILIWVECNLYDDDWRVYIAEVRSSAEIGEAILVDEGDLDFDPPMLCVSGDAAFWTVMPSEDGSATSSDSYLKKASLSNTSPQIAYTSHGRMITNPQATDGVVTIVPRANTSSTRYQLTALDASTLEVLCAQILPSSMRAYDAIYMDESMIFSIESSYDYGDGISSFGTYAPMGDGQYVRFNRTPMDTPVICGDYLVVKSTSSIVGLKLSEQSYFAIPVVSGCESYGDFLMSVGKSERIVAYTSVPSGDGSGDGVVTVRVFNVT